MTPDNAAVPDIIHVDLQRMTSARSGTLSPSTHRYALPEP